ncbi:MAG: hypothetical protein K2X43_24070 [Hyphomonadaceae bacterium]|nr:hypothetical protein [Hyphomonadaceae bacterium]
MKRKLQAFAGLWRGSSRWRQGVRLALVAAGTALAGGGAQAARGIDCAAVNGGALNVALGTERSATRHAELKAGDTLLFTFEAADGPFGTLTLRRGADAPRALLVGPTGTRVSFVAARGGVFDFEFSKEGADAAAFTASCVSAGSARGGAPAGGAHHAAGLPHGPLAESLEMAEPAGIALDGAAPGRTASATPWAGEARPAARVVPAYPGGVELKLEWRGERYRAGGPDGLEVDTTASGVNAALNYKLLPQIMVGALAQIDQPGQTLVGVPHSLLDQGWLLGPVTNVKLAPGLVLDARAAWGVVESGADELSQRMVSVPRRMVSARLANTQSFGAWRFTPSISVNHTQEAAVASSPAAPQDAAAPYAGGSGRVDIGPEFAYRIDLDQSMFIEPRAAIGSFWGIDTLSRLAPGAVGHNDMRLKAEAGVTIGAAGGTKLQAGGGVEEGEPGAANVWSGRLQLSVPVQ